MKNSVQSGKYLHSYSTIVMGDTFQFWLEFDQVNSEQVSLILILTIRDNPVSVPVENPYITLHKDNKGDDFMQSTQSNILLLIIMQLVTRLLAFDCDRSQQRFCMRPTSRLSPNSIYEWKQLWTQFVFCCSFVGSVSWFTHTRRLWTKCAAPEPSVYL